MYVSYGTVAPQGDAYPGIYREAIEQLAGLDVRVLLNTGRQDPAELGPLPAGVHAERWVREASVLPHVAAMVSHGGAGSVRTALAAGVPLALAAALRRPAAQRARRRGGRRRARRRAAPAGSARRVTALLDRPGLRDARRPRSRPRSTRCPSAGEAIAVLRDGRSPCTT